MQMLWDNKYRQGLPSLTEPDPFFCSIYHSYLQQIYPHGGASVLDLAAGSGRHSLFLAELGWKITAVDISPVGLQILEDKASTLGVNIDTTIADLTDYQLPRHRFDVVVLYYHFDRSLFYRIYNSLKPGGILVCKLAVNWSNIVDADVTAPLPLQKDEFLSLVTRFFTIEHTERPAGNRGVVEYLGIKK